MSDGHQWIWEYQAFQDSGLLRTLSSVQSVQWRWYLSDFWNGFNVAIMYKSETCAIEWFEQATIHGNKLAVWKLFVYPAYSFLLPL